LQTHPCVCGNRLHFENNHCLQCGRLAGYLPDAGHMAGLDPAGDGAWRSVELGRDYRRCANDRDYQVCNWLVPVDDGHAYCASCRLNHIIPNLTEPRNLTRWYRVEVAKRRLLFTLARLDLPIVGRDEDPAHGLAFRFLADEDTYDEFSDSADGHRTVMTGHSSGVITINIAEAEDSERERVREQMNEGYRTLLGHFRHESGHYYWERLIGERADELTVFREHFGDEREDYAAALERYYREGPLPGWQSSWISAYASSHPLEDWAECWAHYLHVVDTLETARDMGLLPPAGATQPGADGLDDYDRLINDWAELSMSLNALNRSMGLGDAYPFCLSPGVRTKLRFVHELIARA